MKRKPRDKRQEQRKYIPGSTIKRLRLQFQREKESKDMNKDNK